MWNLIENPFWLFPCCYTCQHIVPTRLCASLPRAQEPWGGEMEQRLGKISSHLGNSEAPGMIQMSVSAQAAGAEQIWEADSHGELLNMFDLDRCQRPENQGSFSFSSKIPLKYYRTRHFSNINIHYTHTQIYKSINPSVYTLSTWVVPLLWELCTSRQFCHLRV